MLAHNYPDGVDKIQLFSGPNYTCLMTKYTLLTDLLFQQIIIVTLLVSKDFSATVFTVGEKAMSYQTHSQTKEIKEAIQIVLIFSLHSDSCVWILLWV